MKRFLFLLLCLPTVLTAQWRMVSSSVSLNSTVDDSTYVIDVNFFSDLTGGGYLATGITADFLVFSQSGELYDITAATNLTLSSGRLTIVEVDNDYVDTEGTPTGQIIVYDPQGEYIPVTPFGNSNMGNVLQGAAIAYNSKIKNQLAIATIDDTSSVISPYEGQLVYIKDAGNYQVRGAHTWSALDPGGGGSGDVTGPGTSTDESIATFNGTGNTIQSSSVTIDDSGNISTSGTVDGRDVSADGGKLDGIEAGATADQNAGEVPFTPVDKIPGSDVQTALGQLRDSLNLNVAKVNSTTGFINALAAGYETIQFDTGTIALTQDLLINRKVKVVIPERCTLTLSSGSTASYYFKSPFFSDPSSRYGAAMFMLDSLSDGSTIQFDGTVTFSGVSFLTCGACSPASTATKEHAFFLYKSDRTRIVGNGHIIAAWDGISVVDSDDVYIDGISATGFGVDKNAAIQIEGSRNGTVKNLYVEDAEEGIDFNTAGSGWTLENIRCVDCSQAVVEVNNSRNIYGTNITGYNSEKTLEIFDYAIAEQNPTGVGMGIWSSRVWNAASDSEFFVVDNENLRLQAVAIVDSTNTYSDNNARCFNIEGGKWINLDVSARLTGPFTTSNDIFQVLSWDGNTLSGNTDVGKNNSLKINISADTLAFSSTALIQINSPGLLSMDITGTSALSPSQTFVNIERTDPGTSITKLRSYRINSTGSGTGITSEDDQFNIVIFEDGESTGFNQDLSIGDGAKVPVNLTSIQNNSFGYSYMPYDSLRLGGLNYSGYFNLAASGSNAVNYIMGTPGSNYFQLNYKSGTGFRFYDKDGDLRMFFPDDDRVAADFGFSGAAQNTGIRIPLGTTAQRPGTPGAGDIRYNSELGYFEGYTSEWIQFAPTALIPDNISDLTISSTVDFNDNRITGVANAQVSSDAVNKTQLDSLGTVLSNSHALDLIAGTDGDTIVLDTRETLLVLDGALGDPATFYIDGSALSSGAKLYIKYGGFSGNATIDRDDDNDPGNFLGVSTTSGSTTLTYSGTGFSCLLKSGATWYEMY